MSAISISSGGVKACEFHPLDTQMVELPLLLPAWQASELEKAANNRGLTAGQMVRQVLRDFMARLQATRSEPWDCQDQWD